MRIAFNTIISVLFGGTAFALADAHSNVQRDTLHVPSSIKRAGEG